MILYDVINKTKCKENSSKKTNKEKTHQQRSMSISEKACSSTSKKQDYKGFFSITTNTKVARENSSIEKEDSFTHKFNNLKKCKNDNALDINSSSEENSSLSAKEDNFLQTDLINMINCNSVASHSLSIQNSLSSSIVDGDILKIGDCSDYKNEVFH